MISIEPPWTCESRKQTPLLLLSPEQSEAKGRECLSAQFLYNLLDTSRYRLIGCKTQRFVSPSLAQLHFRV
jgi:hypothetical protein